MSNQARLLYVYASEDEALRRALEAHLSSLGREGRIHSWHAGLLPAGAVVDQQLGAELLQADVVLLLLSADFMASKPCQDLLAQVQHQRTARQLLVVPILARPVDFHGTGLDTLQALPRNLRAVTSWSNRDEAWLAVAQDIRLLLDARARPTPRPATTLPLRTPGSAVRAAAASPADVLIITALKEEYDEVRRVDTGAIDDAWSVDHQLTGFEVALRSYRSVNGPPLRVALTWASRMRTTATADAAGRLIDRLGVRCLAMSGVCAGRRGKVSPGDVIIASLLYTYDAGALRVELDEHGHAHQRIQCDPDPTPLDEQWRHRAQAFQAPPGEWQALRPITLEQQGRWLLERLRLEPGAELSRHPDRSRCCPAWAAVISRLRQRKLVTRQAPLALTKAGIQCIDDLLLMQPDGQLGPPTPQAWLGAIATGNHVMRDPQLFDRLSASMREVLGVDMEAAAIGAIGHARKLPWVVMKGVMDHADHDKDDQFKRFAARAAAECLLAFLRQNLSGSNRDTQNPTAATKKSFRRVHTLIEASDLAAADRELEQTVGTLRSSADYWYWKSRVAFARHNLDVASAYSEEALKQDPRHLHGIVLRIKLLLLSTKAGERQKVTELAQRSYGISDALDAWLRGVTSEEKFASGVCTNTELDARCPPPAHEWPGESSDY